MDVGSCNREFHVNRRNSKGVSALNVIANVLEMEDVSKRVGLRLFMEVDVDGIVLS
jgi:hypothetical protein